MRATVNDADRAHPNTPDNKDQTRERQREERRRVVAVNKLGLAAETARRKLIQETMRCAHNTAQRSGDLRRAMPDPQYPSARRTPQPPDLLGLDSTAALSAITNELADNADNRPQILTLALMVGALEARTTTDAWGYAGRGGYGCDAVELPTFLAAKGCALADIEKVVTGKLDAATVYTDTLTAATRTTTPLPKPAEYIPRSGNACSAG